MHLHLISNHHAKFQVFSIFNIIKILSLKHFLLHPLKFLIFVRKKKVYFTILNVIFFCVSIYVLKITAMLISCFYIQQFYRNFNVEQFPSISPFLNFEFFEKQFLPNICILKVISFLNLKFLVPSV